MTLKIRNIWLVSALKSPESWKFGGNMGSETTPLRGHCSPIGVNHADSSITNDNNHGVFDWVS